MRYRPALLLSLLTGVSLLLLSSPTVAQVQAGRVRHFDNLVWKQYYHRGPLKVSLGVGRTWYLGDLTDGLRGSRGRSSIGAGLSSTVWPNLDAAVEAQYIRLAGVDQVPDRGYSFHTRLVELVVLGRYYIEKYHFDPALDSREQARGKWYRPFAVVGVGGAMWWAKAAGGPLILGPDSVAVTSEQKYPAYAMVVPVGGGVALRLSPLLWLLPELTYRLTFSDNLDDVGKRRGNDARNDGFLQFALRFQYTPPRSPGKRLH